MLLNERMQSEIKQKLTSFQNITCIDAVADKEMMSAAFIQYFWCFDPPHFVVQIKRFLQLGSIFLQKSTKEEKRS